MSLAIFRGRYRESFSEPKPLAANQVLPYRFDLPNANHTFQKGHRVMVQVQSSLFPLYDRNPQTYVPNLYLASQAITRRPRSGSGTARRRPATSICRCIELAEVRWSAMPGGGGSAGRWPASTTVPERVDQVDTYQGLAMAG